jgi:monoamine oxidase
MAAMPCIIERFTMHFSGNYLLIEGGLLFLKKQINTLGLQTIAMRKTTQSRSPLLNAIRKAFYIAEQSRQPDAPPANELAGRHALNTQPRRQFIGNMFKAGVAIGAAGFLDACRKGPDFPGLQPKIVIVGAGMSGLNCAYQLKKAGISAAIYEASNRTGGRIFTKRNILAPGLYTELGGEFVDSYHDDMISLCGEFGINLLDTRSDEELQYTRDSYFIDGRFYSEMEVIMAFQPYASRISADINSLPETITYDDHDDVTIRFDQMSLRQYLDSIGMTGFLRDAIETAYLTEYGLETDVQSAINFLYLFNPDTTGGFEIYGESDERYRIEGGNETLTDALFQRVKHKVSLQHQLVKIAHDFTGYTLFFTNPNGTTIKVSADIIVMTIPFSVLRNVQIDVALPGWKRKAIQNLGYGTNSKLLLGFNKRVWREDYRYSGETVTDEDIQTGWENSWLQPGTSGGYTVFQGGRKGLELGAGSPESQAPRFIAQLEKMWPGTASAFNGNVKRMHWPTHPFTLGSYACYKVGQYTTIRGAEGKPVGNLYFAGEHCSLDSQGYMNGAAESGRMAATEILKAIHPVYTVLK